MGESHLDPKTAAMLAELKRSNEESLARLARGATGDASGKAAEPSSKVEIARRLSGIWAGRPDLAAFDGILRGLRKR
jgi:hypothetical protein